MGYDVVDVTFGKAINENELGAHHTRSWPMSIACLSLSIGRVRVWDTSKPKNSATVTKLYLRTNFSTLNFTHTNDYIIAVSRN